MTISPRQILIVQPRRIGDVVVTTPVIEVLRREFPEAAVDFLVEEAPSPVLRGIPGLRDIVVLRKPEFPRLLLKLRRRRYDWVLDFMNNPRTAQLTWFSGAPVRAGFETPFWGWAYNVTVPRPRTPIYAVENKFNLLRRLGLSVEEGLLPRLTITDEDFSPAQSWWGENRLDRFSQRIGLVPIHRHAIRQWPEDKFLALMELLLQKEDRALVLFFGPGEENRVRGMARRFSERVFVIPASSLRTSAALLKRCDVVVTNDSGAMHMSVGVGTPTVTIYGPTHPASWNPGRPPHRYMQAPGLSCVGCNLNRCPYGHECMEWLAPEEAARHVESVLAPVVGT